MVEIARQVIIEFVIPTPPNAIQEACATLLARVQDGEGFLCILALIYFVASSVSGENRGKSIEFPRNSANGSANDYLNRPEIFPAPTRPPLPFGLAFAMSYAVSGQLGAGLGAVGVSQAEGASFSCRSTCLSTSSLETQVGA